jgi:hypothetical protein
VKLHIALAAILFITLAALAYQSHAPHQPVVPPSLTAYVPQDALLSIESPDFAALLKRWSNSAESKSWLTSDNYSVFQNSRLFSRLSDAQEQFAATAGVPAGIPLLSQVAGTQSVFAWYDVGNLEFLYITHMSAGQANRTALLQSRSSFQRRHAGNADFYIRTGTPAGGQQRTVAFAQVSTPSGDLLLLSTREDLIANALALVAGNATVQPLDREPWFTDASAALPWEKSPPALHMVLNLDRIVPMAQFRTYWVQQNITWMDQYRAAVSDLYLEPSSFREERVLLPKSPPQLASTSATDASQLAALAPPGTGFFRALVTTNPLDAVDAIQEKLLGAYTPEKARDEYAPDPDIEPPQSGSAGDLETRIDTPTPVSASASYDALTHTLQSAGFDALLTLCSAQLPAAKEGLWVPIHSAVVLHAANPWNPQILASALQQSLRGSLTASDLGIEFHPTQAPSNQTIYALTGPRPLFFATTTSAVQGNLAILSDDQPELLTLLAGVHQPVQPTSAASLVAGFNHTSQRAPYIRLSSLIDGNNQKPSATPTSVPLQPPANSEADDSDQTPPTPYAADTRVNANPTFFSHNIRSLSDTFITLDSERLVQRTVDSNLRQTVTYQWQPQ